MVISLVVFWTISQYRNILISCGVVLGKMYLDFVLLLYLARAIKYQNKSIYNR